MAPAAAEVLSDALALTTEERAASIHALLTTLDDPPDEDADEIAPAWGTELERRANGVADGTIATRPFGEAMAEIRAGSEGEA